jgi:hypothetical protein
LDPPVFKNLTSFIVLWVTRTGKSWDQQLFGFKNLKKLAEKLTSLDLTQFQKTRLLKTGKTGPKQSAAALETVTNNQCTH